MSRGKKDPCPIWHLTHLPCAAVLQQALVLLQQEEIHPSKVPAHLFKVVNFDAGWSVSTVADRLKKESLYREAVENKKTADEKRRGGAKEPKVDRSKDKRASASYCTLPPRQILAERPTIQTVVSVMDRVREGRLAMRAGYAYLREQAFPALVRESAPQDPCYDAVRRSALATRALIEMVKGAKAQEGDDEEEGEGEEEEGRQPTHWEKGEVGMCLAQAVSTQESGACASGVAAHDIWWGVISGALSALTEVVEEQTGVLLRHLGESACEEGVAGDLSPLHKLLQEVESSTGAAAESCPSYACEGSAATAKALPSSGTSPVSHRFTGWRALVRTRIVPKEAKARALAAWIAALVQALPTVRTLDEGSHAVTSRNHIRALCRSLSRSLTTAERSLVNGLVLLVPANSSQSPQDHPFIKESWDEAEKRSHNTSSPPKPNSGACGNVVAEVLAKAFEVSKGYVPSGIWESEFRTLGAQIAGVNFQKATREFQLAEAQLLHTRRTLCWDLERGKSCGLMAVLFAAGGEGRYELRRSTLVPKRPFALTGPAHIWIVGFQVCMGQRPEAARKRKAQDEPQQPLMWLNKPVPVRAKAGIEVQVRRICLSSSVHCTGIRANMTLRVSRMGDARRAMQPCWDAVLRTGSSPKDLRDKFHRGSSEGGALYRRELENFWACGGSPATHHASLQEEGAAATRKLVRLKARLMGIKAQSEPPACKIGDLQRQITADLIR